MPGCCGGGQSSGSKGEESKQKGRAQRLINTNVGNNKCVPGGRGGGRGQASRMRHHDEEICHGTGERRRDLLDQLKIYLSEFDDTPCKGKPPQQGPDAIRSLGSYSEYLKKHCQSWMHPNPKPPLITSVQTHEIRATSDYNKMKGETSEYVSFTDATLRPPPETCDCVKRNGLQDQCPHPMCKPPTAQCKANNPGPCCPPSMGLGGPPAVLESKGATGGSGSAGGNWGTNGNGGDLPQTLPYSEYQSSFGPGPRQPPSPTPEVSYTTTYRQDFQQGQPKPPPGMDMACICNATSAALPSGKKYLCIPIPQ